MAVKGRKKTVEVADALPPCDLAAIADVHVHNHARFGGEWEKGLNRRGRETVGALRTAVEAARARGAKALVICGDLYDVRRPDPAIVAAVQRALADFPTIVIPGNHDCLDAGAGTGNTACAPLWGQATVVNEPTWFDVGALKVFCVPFTNEVPMARHLAEVLEKHLGEDNGKRVLATHVGVFDDETAPPWMRNARDAIGAKAFLELLRDYGFSLALVGNYHDHGCWVGGGPKIVQIGALCPKGWGEPGVVGRGYMACVSPGGAVEYATIPGPRFITVQEGGLAWPAPQEGCSYYVKDVGEKPCKAPVWEKPEALVSFEHSPPSKPREGGAGAAPGEAREPEAVLRDLPLWYDGPVDKDDLRDLVLECWTEAAT